MAEGFKDVSIPSSLYERISAKIKDSEFDSVSAYIVKIVEESLSKEQAKEKDLSKEDEEKIKERLKALGYMD